MEESNQKKIDVDYIKSTIDNLHHLEKENGGDPEDGLRILKDVARIYLPTREVFSILWFQVKCKLILWKRTVTYKLKF